MISMLGVLIVFRAITAHNLSNRQRSAYPSSPDQISSPSLISVTPGTDRIASRASRSSEIEETVPLRVTLLPRTATEIRAPLRSAICTRAVSILDLMSSTNPGGFTVIKLVTPHTAEVAYSFLGARLVVKQLDLAFQSDMAMLHLHLHLWLRGFPPRFQVV